MPAQFDYPGDMLCPGTEHGTILCPGHPGMPVTKQKLSDLLSPSAVPPGFPVRTTLIPWSLQQLHKIEVAAFTGTLYSSR